MSEEPKSNIRFVKRIKPGVALSLIVMIVSALLVYKIQNTDSVRPQHESLSLPMQEEDRIANEQSEKLTQARFHPDQVPSQNETDLALLPDVKLVNEGELDSSSWQNPFDRLFWRSNGWKFTADEMVSSKGELSVATFVRPYKKISVSFQVEAKPKFPSFELQLLTRNPSKPNEVLIASQILFQTDAISVFAVNEKATEELKQAKLTLDREKMKSVPIRFVGTGNRFVISVAGQRVLACAQPALQSGRECFLSFLANKDRLRISALRIEGE